MNTDEPASGGKSFSTALLIVISLAVVVTILIRQQTFPQVPMQPIPAPRIQADGWLNGPGPTMEELKGKVIVVDAWAYWCVPCRRAAPEMVSLFEKYQDRVTFIGLTSEGVDADSENRQFLEATRIKWPNGYGAIQTLTDLNAEFIPQRWVIDRKYNLIWNESSRESIESAIERALAEP